jgi:folate-dependent phosphoribosylglycinamide formyltransferase PurN
VKVVVLTRNPRGIASRFLARGRSPVEAVLLDESAVESRVAQARRKAQKLRRVGLSALPVGLALRRAYAAAGGLDVALLGELGVPVERVASLNSEAARATLRRLAPDVAVSLDNALIAEDTFSIPRLGTINVHHGSVPDYAGGPPVFWELADSRDRVGFTVHLIDAGIDTGPVFAAGEVPIVERPTLARTLAATVPALHEASLEELEKVLEQLERGQLEARAQEPRDGPLRTTPTLRDYLRVRRRLREYDRPS